MSHSIVIDAIGAVAVLMVPLTAFGLQDLIGNQTSPARVATVEIQPGDFHFARAGEFLVGGRPTAAVLDTMAFDRPVEIMKFQVRFADYQACVVDGGCAAPGASPTSADVPVTGVSYLDALAYAAWYSEATGETWRLPTDADWAFAARERFAGEPYSTGADDPDNPAVAWIRRYREDAAAKRQPDPEPKPLGFYGANTNGVFDLAGNVWEWTSDCYVRFTLAANRVTELTRVENCGVHVVEGRHRAYMSNFIQDARSGGCAYGTPPDKLGFRLVRERAAAQPRTG